MGMSIAAWAVRVIHALLVAWIVWAPFSGRVEMLALHALACPFLLLHWATSTDGCALTVLECWLRGVPPGKSFVHSVVAPIYVIDDATLRLGVAAATTALWVVTLRRLRFRDFVGVFTAAPRAPSTGT